MPGSLFNLSRIISRSGKGKDPSESSSGEKKESRETTKAPLSPPPLKNKEPAAYKPKESKSIMGNAQENEEKNEEAKLANKPSDLESISSKSEDKLQKRTDMDILSRLTQRSNKALTASVRKASELGVKHVDTEHVLWGLMQDSGVYKLVSEYKIAPTDLVKDIEKTFKKGSHKNTPKFSPRVKKVFELAFAEARRLGFEFISPEHLLIGLVQEGEGLAAQVLSKKEITSDKLQKKISGKKKKEGIKQKSAAQEFCTDLTALAREGKLDPVVARSKEIERIMHILSRRSKNNPVLIGDAGVGKTAVIEGLAQRIVSGKVPEPLLNKRILSLDLMSLLAGASKRGEFEKRFKTLISEVKASQGQIILFIDEIHNLVGAGGKEGVADASNILKPSLARGEMQTIGTTTVSEYRKHIEKDRALERRLQPVMINEPNEEDALEMLRAIKGKYEAFHKVSITEDALKSAVRLSARYIGDRFLPDKAIDLIDEAASAVRMPAISLPEEIRQLENELKRQNAELNDAELSGNTVRRESIKRKQEEITQRLKEKSKEHEMRKGTSVSTVTPEVIQQIVSRWTGIPISRLTKSESEKLVSLEDAIHKKLIDQEDAVAAVSESVRRGRAGLSSKNRPIGSFIFMGPTGVGKTELAKVLAEELFGSSDLMVRLDMTEYMEKHEVAKLIGAPPGYVGYEEGGQLTEAVRRKPYSVVLLDEIEKAHPEVFNILLQILDDGRLTDNKGRTISFKNTILICTSNVGTSLIQEHLLSNMKVGQPELPETAKNNRIETYTVTPTGREIVTIGTDVFEREKRPWQALQTEGQGAGAWKTKPLIKYFAGQKVVPSEISTSTTRFPESSLSTHTVFPSGVELVTQNDRLWKRSSTTAKEWERLTLLDYVKDHSVSNARLDSPEEQLPTASWDTHAVNGQEQEFISVGNRVWIRDTQTSTVWRTLTKKDYIAIYSEKINESGNQQTSSSEKKELDEDSKNMVLNDNEGERDTIQNKAVSHKDLPETENTWDVHMFTPEDKEVIIVGETYWMRKSSARFWVSGSIYDLLAGENAPVFKEKQEQKTENQKPEDDEFSSLAERLIGELRKFFRPELLNRFDEVVVFRPLTAQHMLSIVSLQLVQLSKTLEEQGYGFEATDGAKEEITVVGFDPVFGARPLRRTIQRLIENPISTMIIKKELKDGDTILVDFDKASDKFVFRVRGVEPQKQQEEAVTKSENGELSAKAEPPSNAEDEKKPQNTPGFKGQEDVSLPMETAKEEQTSGEVSKQSGEAVEELDEETGQVLSEEFADGNAAKEVKHPEQSNQSGSEMHGLEESMELDENGLSSQTSDETPAQQAASAEELPSIPHFKDISQGSSQSQPQPVESNG